MLCFSMIWFQFISRWDFQYGESNPELEVNKKVQAQWSAFESVQHKRRRAYKKVF